MTAATTPQQRQAIATSTQQAPVQKFHWVHYPPNVTDGTYTYTATAMLFKPGSETDIEPGPTATATVDLLNQGYLMS